MDAGAGPYVGLDFFAEEDAALFFGRAAERKRIIANLRASRLTLLYASSGVGKSSLLRAGVAARVRAASGQARNGHRFVPVVFSTWRADPRADLLGALEDTLRPFAPDGRLSLSRDGLGPALRDAIGRTGTIPLVILDQFEDRLLAPDGDESFEDDLAVCVNHPDVRASFLISIRDDAYAAIGERFKARIPNVYRNFLHLDFLDREAGREAIVGPVEAYNAVSDGPPFEVEDALADAVLDEVERGRVALGEDRPAGAAGRVGGARIETAYLQLVMQRLWNEEVAAGSSRLRLETLKRLGGAAAIVHGHLDDAIAELDDPGQDAAAAALRYLVTSSGRTMAFSTAELSGFSDVPVSRLEPAIDHLERGRILRPVAPAEPDGAAGHELFHDVLAPAVVDWRRRHVRRREREAAERALEEQRAEAALALERERRRAIALEARNRRLGAAVIALLAMVAALVVYARDPDAVRRLELGTVDARFRLRPDTTPADVTLVAVRPPPQAPFTRRDYGDLVRAIDAMRPRAIAVDVAFDATDVDPAQTKALLRAIGTVRTPVAFAYTAFDVRPTDHETLALVPATAPYDRNRRRCAARAAHRVCFGYAGMPVDPDDGVRRLEGSTPTTNGGPQLVPLPVWVARLAGARALGASVRHGAARRAWHGQTEETMWIDYRGPPATIRTVRAADVLAGRPPRAALRGKVVVVGNTSGVDVVRKTPFGRRVPGPDVQAAAIDTLLRGAPLRDVPFGVDIALIVLLAMVAPAVLVLTGSTVRAALAAVAAAALLLLGAYLAFRVGRVVSVVVPLGALVVATAGVLARGPVIGLWSRLRGARAGVAAR